MGIKLIVQDDSDYSFCVLTPMAINLTNEITEENLRKDWYNKYAKPLEEKYTSPVRKEINTYKVWNEASKIKPFIDFLIEEKGFEKLEDSEILFI